MKEENNKLLLENIERIEHEGKIMREVIDKHENVRERANKYAYQLITIFGLVAGFGFTAIGHVKTIYLFIIGEAILFIAIGVGINFVKKAFIDEAKPYAGYIDKLGKVIDKRTEIKWQESEETIRDKMNEITQEELKIFDDKPANINSDRAFKTMYWLFFLGGFFLLVSLINISTFF